MRTRKRSFKSFWQRTMESNHRGTETQRRIRVLTAIVLCVSLCLWLCISAEAQHFPKARKDTGPKPKIIHGVVQDARGKILVGARVFLKNVNTNVMRTLETDQNGE